MDTVVNEINKELSNKFNDYHGLYFYGSRMSGKNNEESDYDMVLIFDTVDYNKKLEIAGITGEIEYQNNVFIDVKIMTVKGENSPEDIRKNINPAFISEAIDKGIFYDRR